jgi:DNA-binding IclR family transcriptional regulator
MPAFTDTTITDRRRLEQELAATRRKGYGVCRGEFEANLFGVSAPVLDRRDRPFAVVSIWGPRERVPEARLGQLGEVAIAAAAAIGEARRDLGAAS